MTIPPAGAADVSVTVPVDEVGRIDPEAVARAAAGGAALASFALANHELGNLYDVATLGAAAGYVSVYSAGIAPPLVSVINYVAGQTRSNNGVVGLGPGGDFVVQSGQATGTVHVVIDVNGYFK